MNDMRSFLDAWRAAYPDEFVEVRRPVSPAFEMVAVQRKLAAEGRWPVILFRHVEGCDAPVVMGLYHDRRRLAFGLGVEEGGLTERLRAAEERPVAPVYAPEAPVQEVVRRDDEVDLRTLPILHSHEQDAGPYLTASIVLAREPASGAHNVSFGRFQVIDGRTLRTHIGPGRHLHQIRSANERAGRPTPLSINLGSPPAWAIGALSLVPIDYDELRVMGSLAGGPVRLGRCLTVEADCLADAEIVLEGYLIPGERGTEGPFCEFPGYSTGAAEHEVFRVTAVTTRRNPIYQHLTSGSPGHCLIGAVAKEGSLLRVARGAAPSVRAVHLPLSGCGRFICYVSLEQLARGQGRGVAAAILSADIYVKLVVVVDHDIDVFNEREVLWAIATRAQPDRDFTVLPGMRGTEVDPSCIESGVTSKLVIDATAKPSFAEFAPRAALPAGRWDGLSLADYLAG